MNTALMFSSATDKWATPQPFFDALNAEFQFAIDVCADATNAKCERYFDEAADGLKQDWRGICWMNPPYGREVSKWVAKASLEAHIGAVVVCLLPARTDTAWWHNHIWDARTHQPHLGVEVRLLRGRLKFGGHNNSAPFPSAVVVFRGYAL